MSETPTINGWRVDRDNRNEVSGGRHFVAKRPFDEEGCGLSLMAKESFGDSFIVELATEHDNSVSACFRLSNSASEQEAAELVDQVTEAI